ncbi:DNA-3-methyladenine glycosylase [Pirellulaceae bacterium]|nr:DNA-3-methyladenine glycosylase [Pirellulaceae bacterium]
MQKSSLTLSKLKKASDTVILENQLGSGAPLLPTKGSSPNHLQQIPSSLLASSTQRVAKDLIGLYLVRYTTPGTMISRIVETEAYLWKNDTACHAAKGRTTRNAAMFSAAGTIYVYSIHHHHCFNIVTGKEGQGSAVLIRAAEPLQGIELMKQNRPKIKTEDLLRGPGKLCQTLNIDKKINGAALGTKSGIQIVFGDGLRKNEQIKTSQRIGVTSAEELLLRFVVRGSPYASGTKKINR